VWRQPQRSAADRPYVSRYVGLQEEGVSGGNTLPKRTGRRKRRKPFEAEWALLKELGLA
jgi:hypothetical protein